MVTVPPIEQQDLKSHAQFYRQGGRDAYALIMDLETLDNVLPTPPPEASTKIVGSNRKFHMPHARAIKDYLYKEDDWVLGTILLGIDPSYVKFEPYDESGQPSKSLGRLNISVLGGLSSIEILDGQHRRMAIRLVLRQLVKDLNDMDEHGGNGKRAADHLYAGLNNRLESLKRMSIPVSIYAEPDVTNRSRMFSDLAKTRNIDAITKARFDDRDPYNRAALEIVDNGLSDLLRGKIELERSTPPRGSDNLMSLNQLARCLSILSYGYGSRVSKARVIESQGNFAEIVDHGIEWADEFLPNSRQEYDDLCSIELEQDFVASNRSRYIAYSVTALQLMASCHYEAIQRGLPIEALAGWLRQADFDLDSDECIFLKAGMYIPGESSLASRRKNMQDGIDYIVTQAILANG